MGTEDLAGALASHWAMVHGLRIHARCAVDRAPPVRPPLVLVHGVAVSSRNMVPSAVAFASHVPVYSPDLPGHGRSDHTDHVLATHELADFLAGWIRVTGLGAANLLGNSFGCQIAAEVAVRHPALVRRLVVQGPTTDPHACSYTRQIVRWVRNGTLPVIGKVAQLVSGTGGSPRRSRCLSLGSFGTRRVCVRVWREGRLHEEDPRRGGRD